MNKQEYVVIIEKSAGNESIGDMWKETKIFTGDATIDEVMEWAMGRDWRTGRMHSRSQITLTKPHCD